MITTAQEIEIATHMAATGWLKRIDRALQGTTKKSGDYSLRKINAAARLWIQMCAEIGIDWPTVCREAVESGNDDLVPTVMDRIMRAAKRAVA